MTMHVLKLFEILDIMASAEKFTKRAIRTQQMLTLLIFDHQSSRSYATGEEQVQAIRRETQDCTLKNVDLTSIGRIDSESSDIEADS